MIVILCFARRKSKRIVQDRQITGLIEDGGQYKKKYGFSFGFMHCILFYPFYLPGQITLMRAEPKKYRPVFRRPTTDN